MQKVETNGNIKPHWLDTIVDGPKAKIIACLPVISSIILGCKKARYEKIVKDSSLTETHKIEALKNLNKFALTATSWGSAQMIIAGLAIAILLGGVASISSILFSVAGLVGVVAAGVLIVGVVGLTLAIQLHHWSIMYVVHKKTTQREKEVKALVDAKISELRAEEGKNMSDLHDFDKRDCVNSVKQNELNKLKMSLEDETAPLKNELVLIWHLRWKHLLPPDLAAERAILFEKNKTLKNEIERINLAFMTDPLIVPEGV